MFVSSNLLKRLSNFSMPLYASIEAIHIAVLRVNCFDVRHFLWLFMSCFALSVFAEGVFSQHKVDFVNQFVIFFYSFFVAFNCHVS
jgi:hypothetical protein